ncbi:hypothetical protein GTY75_12435 [Streptomyces sp. SID8381]|uniref:hypothetical protein n=1 Tax=unclassified Streptomyces TaxID=2593676 RepID=UPI0003759281|nr:MULTISPECIES: hypothetical protein [unclassified Streptomyces]MYX27449.1 hypothetical protein [Streptomyces sp. SID8381]
MTPPAPPTAPATELQKHLTDSLDKAHFQARVDTGAADGSLDLTVYSQKAPFTNDRDAAQWLDQAGIAATATLNDGLYVVLNLPTADAVLRFIDQLLMPWVTAYTAADQLETLLDSHAVTSDLAVGADRITLTLADEDLAGVVTLATLLGAPGIDAGLALHRRRGVRRLAERMQWLLSGIAGSVVQTTAEAGCEHACARLELHLTVDQTYRLLERLGATQHSTPTGRAS